MIDTQYIDTLLGVLKRNGVLRFKAGDLELVLNEVLEPNSKPRPETQDHQIEVPVDEATLPPDLRTDKITDLDTVLNWSASPANEEPLVGTGE